MRAVATQLGARMHYAVPRIFHEAGMLEQFFTDCYLGNKPWLEAGLRSIPERFRQRSVEKWLGRSDRRLPGKKVTSFDCLGIAYHIRLREARSSVDINRAFAWAGREFGSRVARAGFGDADTVWGFNGASLEIFVAAKRQKLCCILEQTIGPLPIQKRLLLAERERWPGWQLNEPEVGDSTELEQRERAEWEHADVIVCGSQFVVDGIAECGGPFHKCRVVPYGVDLSAYPIKQPRPRLPVEPLRVLFAGEVGLRKGAPWLFEALRTLGPARIEARFAGPIALSDKKLAPYAGLATFLGAVPRARMPELFAWADVFILPSICEGSATVTYEAIASGVPVICTPNTGALLSPAVTIVPVGDVSALAAAITAHDRADASRSMAPKYRYQYGLDAYAERLLAAVRDTRPGCRADAAA